MNKTLRDKAIGINERAFKVNSNGTKEDLGIMASYLHKDVKEAVLNKNKNLQYKINYLKQQKNENKIYTINAIIGIFEDELKENKKIFGDFEK